MADSAGRTQSSTEGGAKPALSPWLDPGQRPYVRLERVTKTYGDAFAIDDLSLSVFRGELFALLGGSGCGKTTLLRLLAGFETPSSGRLYIDGVDVTNLAPYDRPVNMMFQSYALFPHMTVEANVAFGLHQDRVPRAEIRARVAEALELVQMAAFGRRRPHQLSGGQKQRVALARSLIKRPKLLLLDEPLAALDKKLREQTQFELVTIQEKVGITFIMVTHDQEEAMAMASRIAVMDQGAIVQIGTPNEVYEYPNSRFVAGFIGQVNLFEGRVVGDEPDHVVIASPESGCPLYIGHGISGTLGAPVAVAVRPEKIVLSKEPPPGTTAGGPNLARGVVKEIAYLGTFSTYLVQLTTGKMVRVTAPNLVRMAELPVSRDDDVTLSWGPNAGVVLMQ